MPSIFTRIIHGEIPCYKIYEDENFFAFLDISPLQRGHTLVVPKKEVDYIFDLDEKTYEAFFSTAKKIAHAVEAAVPCKRIGIAVVGIEVPHAHIHLIPLSTVNAISFSDPKLTLPKEEMENIAASIRASFRAE